MGKGNNVVPNRHFHKNWAERVKLWFGQPMRKIRRRQNRVKKARAVAPRPVKPLRPIVHCPTFRYNAKEREGKGFTLAELKGAGLNKNFARTIGIAVDHRRYNKSLESMQKNIQRLQEYKSKLILFPRKNATKVRAGEASPEEQKLAVQQNIKEVMPVKAKSSTKDLIEIGKIDESMKKFNAYATLRTARADKRLVGIRAKRAKEAADNADDPTKKPSAK